VDSANYRDTYAVVSSILQISPQITIEKIGAQLGHQELVTVAKKILIKYKERFTNSLPEIQRQNVKFDTASFISVPLVLAAEYRNVRVDRQLILDLTETRLKDFKKIYDSMNELVMLPIKAELEKIQQQQKKDPKSKRKRSNKKKNPINSEESSQLISNSPIESLPKDSTLQILSPIDPPSTKESPPKKLIRSELNSNVLVNQDKITEDQIEQDIQELAFNENNTITLPKPLLALKRKKDFELWKETILSVPNVVKTVTAAEQTTLDDFISIAKKKPKLTKENSQLSETMIL